MLIQDFIADTKIQIIENGKISKKINLNKLQSKLIKDIKTSLRQQGFIVNGYDNLEIAEKSKGEIRNIQLEAKKRQYINIIAF